MSPLERTGALIRTSARPRRKSVLLLVSSSARTDARILTHRDARRARDHQRLRPMIHLAIFTERDAGEQHGSYEQHGAKSPNPTQTSLNSTGLDAPERAWTKIRGHSPCNSVCIPPLCATPSDGYVRRNIAHDQQRSGDGPDASSSALERPQRVVVSGQRSARISS